MRQNHIVFLTKEEAVMYDTNIMLKLADALFRKKLITLDEKVKVVELIKETKNA